MTTKPLLIALCGRPTSGKSEVQRILMKRFIISPIDDGQILRVHCRELFNLSAADTETQDGKRRITDIQGKPWENRKIIGEYGNILEQKFGNLVIPNWAIRQAHTHWDMLNTAAASHACLGYSFGSVRRGQGQAYRAQGGLVIEIDRPTVEQSGNVWDLYDPKYVTHTFQNTASDLEKLEDEVVEFFSPIVSNWDVES